MKFFWHSNSIGDLYLVESDGSKHPGTLHDGVRRLTEDHALAGQVTIRLVHGLGQRRLTAGG